jgi:membrane protein involved in colicin uptake
VAKREAKAEQKAKMAQEAAVAEERRASERAAADQRKAVEKAEKEATKAAVADQWSAAASPPDTKMFRPVTTDASRNLAACGSTTRGQPAH